MKKFTIIGGGATGTLLVVNLIKNAGSEPFEINLVEKRERLGRGVAYSATTDFHLLNVPAAKMGAFPDAVEHFYNWLVENNYDFEPNSFVPRKIYGDYLREVFRQAVAAKPENVSVNVFDDEVVDLTISDSESEVILSSGKRIFSDKVVLAFGNFLPPHPKSENRNFIEAENYFQNPWNASMFERIKPEDDIFIIGTGLTAIDVVLSLRNAAHKGRIFAFSTRGLLPEVHRLGFTYPSFYDELKSEKRITDLLKIVRRHVQKATEEQSDWRAVIDSLRPHTQEIWLNLPTAEKRYFMQHLSRYWNVARHRIPPVAAKILDEMQTTDSLKILKGRLKNIESADGKFNVSFTADGVEKHLSFDAVINCIGSESNFERLDNRFVKNLIGKGYIKNDRLNLGIDSTPGGKTIDASGKVSDTLLTIGTSLKGILWESTAMPEIRAQANKLALTLVQ